MRPRFIAAAAVVALCAIVLAALLLRPDPPPPGPSAALSTRGPVLLIPGYGGGTQGLQVTAGVLRAAGFQAEVVSIGDGTGDLAVYAQQVVARAQQLVSAGAPSVDVIGFSAGGVIARDAATSAMGRPLIRKVVTVGSPHQGTKLAALGGLFGGCPVACGQLAPRSDYLKQLSSANDPDRWLSIWSTTDEVIRPALSSELKGARPFPVQDVCDRPVAHNDLLIDPLVQNTAIAYLNGTALPATCAN